jgi:hypothetical protein
VGPEIPTGREARDAWRALSQPARAAALDAARTGVAPPDVGIAWAGAGYGRLMARRIRLLSMFFPLAMVVLALPATAVAILVLHLSATEAKSVGILVVVLLLAAFFVLARYARRYQRLYSSGLLGVEAVRFGALAPRASPAAWSQSPDDSGFTVPYAATVPVPEPLTRTAADPVAAGTREIPVRLGPVYRYLALLTGVAALLWAMVGLVPGTAMPLIVLAVPYTLLVIFLLYALAPALRRPLLARFTPEGWELPAARLDGPWSGVREIRVKPLAAARSAGHQVATYRIVALIVDDPERQLARLPGLRRALSRRTMRKYGSPVVIVATPGRSIPLVELVQLLQCYTDAPVTWG